MRMNAGLTDTLCRIRLPAAAVSPLAGEYMHFMPGVNKTRRYIGEQLARRGSIGRVKLI